MTEAPDLRTALRSVAGGVELAVFCQPKAARTAVLGAHAGMVKIKVREAAIEGRANEALLDLLAGVLGIPRRQLRLLSGGQSRMKRVFAEGVEEEQVAERLARAAEGRPGHDDQG
ncbi:MAG TPA: DUF167 domain-containing protein [Actinomycetota bacterium]|nr:DUF167 domain-containing protein [Actinomycetota bacterium]